MSGSKGKDDKNRMVIFHQNVEEFVNFSGGTVGPFNSGELVNLESPVAQILVEGGKASYVDDE